MLKLNELGEKLRQRIQRQIDQEDAAKRCDQIKADCNQRVADLAGAKPEPHPRPALGRQVSRRQSSKRRVAICVQITTYVDRITDDDNRGSGPNKPLRDAIASSLGIDDGDKRIKWFYATVFSPGITGTHVLITRL